MPGRADDFSFPASQRKAKNISFNVLSGSAVKIADPFRIDVRPSALWVVLDSFHTRKRALQP